MNESVDGKDESAKDELILGKEEFDSNDGGT